jgi:hypothetical protein
LPVFPRSHDAAMAFRDFPFFVKSSVLGMLCDRDPLLGEVEDYLAAEDRPAFLTLARRLRCRPHRLLRHMNTLCSETAVYLGYDWTPMETRAFVRAVVAGDLAAAEAAVRDNQACSYGFIPPIDYEPDFAADRRVSSRRQKEAAARAERAAAAPADLPAATLACMAAVRSTAKAEHAVKRRVKDRIIAGAEGEDRKRLLEYARLPWR